MEHTFQEDTISMQLLYGELVRMTEALAFKLRKQNKVTGCVVVKLRYSDHDAHDIKQSIAYCNTDHGLIKVVKELFMKLYSRRMLVRMIGLRFTNLIPGTYQIDLFEDSQETLKLYQSIDSIKQRFGERYLKRAT